MERFERFRFAVPAVPLAKGVFLCFSTDSVPVSVPEKRFGSGGSGSDFGFWKNVRSEKLQNESFPNFSNFHPEFCCEFSPNF